MTAYFMGVWPSPSGQVGHYCRLPNGMHVDYRQHLKTPWGGQHDALGDGPPQDAAWGPRKYGTHPNQTEGVARVLVDRGWTLLTCWDRSADKRGGCHASFAFAAVLTPDAALAEARTRFPGVWARIDAHLASKGITFRVEAAP